MEDEKKRPAKRLLNFENLFNWMCALLVHWSAHGSAYSIVIDGTAHGFCALRSCAPLLVRAASDDFKHLFRFLVALRFVARRLRVRNLAVFRSENFSS